VAIARALVRKPRVLLLDEATSALDSNSESIVQQAIDDMISGQRSLDGDPSRSMTVVIIGGKVVELGSHRDLVSKENGAHNHLIRRQLGNVDHEHESAGGDMDS